ncbi:MAG: hypothetical protein JNK82_23725 [Myxococcaceae bacterium]|nr:hypothetical protein [Myxococcaceae bacterium]
MKQKTWALPFGPKPVLDFDASASRIEVQAIEPGAQPRIEAKSTPLEVTQAGDVLRVRIAGWKGAPDFGPGMVSTLLSARYGGEFRLYLPQGVKARIAANMSEVRIRGLAGCDLEVATNAGQLMVEDSRGRFNLRAKAGQIVGKRLGGTFKVESGAGEALLDVVQLDPGAHTVHSTMGSVKLELTPGLDVRIESRTVMGSTRTKYPSNPTADTVIKVEAELGAVKVREGAAYDDPRHGDWPDWRKAWLSDPTGVAVSESPSELRTILELVRQKKLSPEEADRLIDSL